jgi:hypothetical protein
VTVQVIKARYLDPAAAPSRSGCIGALSPSGFRLPLSGVCDSGEWIARGRNRLRGYQRVTGRVEAPSSFCCFCRKWMS